MSEYQVYEFQAVDRPLNDEEITAIRKLSSRVRPTRTSATFVYHWGDFPRKPRDVLVQYFDAMLYLANWGAKRLMFRFPKHLIELEEVRRYQVEELIMFSTAGEYVVLDIHFSEEDGEYWDQVEREGSLSSLVRLREDILRQDYRLLYLAWLKAIPYEDIAPEVYEPPVPAGLQQLSAALQDFIELFEIDEMLVQVAAEASPTIQRPVEEQVYQAVRQLSRAECDDFLIRLAKGEANLPLALNRRLRELAGIGQAAAPSRRTVGQLLAAAEERRGQEAKRLAAEVEAQRLKALEALARREAEAWRQVGALIQEGKARPYDEAVELLKQLRDLAVHQGKEAAFRERMSRIFEAHSRRPALMARLRKVGLVR